MTRRTGTDVNSQHLDQAQITKQGRRTPVLRGVSAWRQLLAEEEQRCERTGFRAGIISIDHGPTEGTADADRTAMVLAVLADQLEWTDRVCVINNSELLILMIPVRSVGATERRARAIDDGMRAIGINAAIGYALRRGDGNGLFGAAARAVACAAVAHSRHIRLTA